MVITANTLSDNIVARKSIHTSIQNLDLITQSVNGLLNHVEDVSKIVVSNDQVQEKLRGSETIDSQKAFESQFVIRSMLDNIVGQGISIDSIAIYATSGEFIHSGNIQVSENETKLFLDSNQFISIKEKWGDPFWTDNLFFSHQNREDNLYGLSMYRAIIDINDGKIIGALEVNIAKNTLHNLYDHIEYGRQGGFLLMNRNGQIISDSIDRHSYRNISPHDFYEQVTNYDKMGRIIQYNGINLLITSSLFHRLEWYAIGFLPTEELRDDNAYIQVILFLIGLFCIAYGIITAKLISRLIAKPVVDLAKSMDRVGRGNLDTRVTVKSHDEVGVLANSFNSMAEQISLLMEQVYLDQTKMRELELNALQEQIKPHFLYNTLESIAALSKLGRRDDVFSMVKTLAMFYRTSLSAGENIVTVDEEVRIANYYLDIQQMRYRDKFDYKFEIDSSIINCDLPKLVIQPLVENAIYHGIKNKRTKGLITISAKRDEQAKSITISVLDNGVGISPEKLSELVRKINIDESNLSFGLKNVNERVKKYFGDDFGIKISSEYGSWTRIDLIIPIRNQVTIGV